MERENKATDLHVIHPFLDLGLNTFTRFFVWTRCLVGIFIASRYSGGLTKSGATQVFGLAW